MTAVYEASPINPNGRVRRTNAELYELDDALFRLSAQIAPATLRQLFYQATVRGLVPKTENGYDLVGRRMSHIRRLVPDTFAWIVDNTRWMRKPTTYKGLEHLLTETAQLYRRDLWADAEAQVEIWIEKDALAGVVYPITDEYDVPLMVTRGYSSLTFAYSAAQAILQREVPTYLYYFGDHDPSGTDIDRVLESYLDEFGASDVASFERVAVLPWQIDSWNLPTRPTKQSDSRAAKFAGESVELDAIPPDDLRDLVRRVIEQHIDEDRLERLRQIEEQERESLANIAAGMRNGDEDE